MRSLLRLEGVVAGYGSARVLHGVDIEVGEGDIAVVLGANGAGKTTTLLTISGFLRPSAGMIEVAGKNVTRLRPEHLVRLGIGMVPAGIGVFRDLSVVDNLRVGAFAVRGDTRHTSGRIDELLERFPQLAERAGQKAARLSGGEQRLLAVARALVGRPKLLLVDEASLGLAPIMVSSIFDLLHGVRDEGVTICLVEQSPVALDIADTAYVMSKGRIVEAASGDSVRDIKERAAGVYLGTTEAA